MKRHGTQLSFRLSPENYHQLFVIKERDGIPLSEQLRRALKMWIDTKDAPTAATVAPQKKKGGRK